MILNFFLRKKCCAAVAEEQEERSKEAGSETQTPGQERRSGERRRTINPKNEGTACRETLGRGTLGWGTRGYYGYLIK